MGRPTTDTSLHDLWAAVDLGSNNFQMLLARRIQDELVVADRFKDKVQLLHGMSADCLQSGAIRRGLSVLRRYRQRLREIPPSRIRVVGTFALRQAENRSAFFEPARLILGVPVEVLSGSDEARLIDLAVSRYLDGERAQTEIGRQRLVVDVGGGSTELVWSERRPGYRQVIETNSPPLGCVSMTDRFFSAVQRSSVTLTRRPGHTPCQS